MQTECSNTDGMELRISIKGVEQWNQSYQIKDPVINVSGKAMAVAERGGNDIYVMDEKGAKGEIHTNYPIEKIAVGGKWNCQYDFK